MLCERCKVREANIQYTEIIDGVKKEHHFCSQCAKDMDQYSSLFEGDFSLKKLLTGLFSQVADEVGKEYGLVVCPTCHTSYDEFLEQSTFGCKDCYNTFGILMEESVKQLQGAKEHKGKVPKIKKKAMVEKTEVESLKEQLQAALEIEDYETAAACRDEIRRLTGGMS